MMAVVPGQTCPGPAGAASSLCTGLCQSRKQAVPPPPVTASCPQADPEDTHWLTHTHTHLSTQKPTHIHLQTHMLARFSWGVYCIRCFWGVGVKWALSQLQWSEQGRRGWEMRGVGEGDKVVRKKVDWDAVCSRCVICWLVFVNVTHWLSLFFKLFCVCKTWCSYTSSADLQNIYNKRNQVLSLNYLWNSFKLWQMLTYKLKLSWNIYWTIIYFLLRCRFHCPCLQSWYLIGGS